MAISIEMIKQLRGMTGAGINECKKALAECNEDIDAAVEFLREKGAATAVKKAGRIAAEGIVKVVVKDDKQAVITEINSETDFVAKNEKFTSFADDVVEQIFASNAADVDALLEEPYVKDGSRTLKQELDSRIGVIGEKISLRRFEKLETDGVFVSYIHLGGKIGVLVEATADEINDDVKTALKNVAMQIAALNPKFASKDDIDPDFIAHEKEVLLAQINNDPAESSKPEKVKEGMINGRINKELKEICLLEQVYVRAEDGKQTVGAYLKSLSGNVVLKSFKRYETGEGIEKKQENFAEEVMKQING